VREGVKYGYVIFLGIKEMADGFCGGGELALQITQICSPLSTDFETSFCKERWPKQEGRPSVTVSLLKVKHKVQKINKER